MRFRVRVRVRVRVMVRVRVRMRVRVRVSVRVRGTNGLRTYSSATLEPSLQGAERFCNGPRRFIVSACGIYVEAHMVCWADSWRRRRRWWCSHGRCGRVVAARVELERVGHHAVEVVVHCGCVSVCVSASVSVSECVSASV